jgi:heme a synthase
MRVYVALSKRMQHVPTVRDSVAEVCRDRATSAARLAWGVLALNVGVVLWGAYVRASGSGAGCGRHWPLCNGDVVPRAPSTATIIEATHRVTSGLALFAVIALAFATWRALPRGHLARKTALASVGFIFAEALIGAGLVLFELVAHDASTKRALSMVLHLTNTFLLLGALALTAWLSGAPSRTSKMPRARALRIAVPFALVAALALGATGAIAALGDTLFPASSLREGLAQDLSPLAHLFLRLRVLHPVLALGSGVVILASAALVRSFGGPRARTLARIVTGLFVAQFALGVLNLALLVPIATQLLHLLFADALWIALVLMAWEALSEDVSEAAVQPSRPRQRPRRAPQDRPARADETEDAA